MARDKLELFIGWAEGFSDEVGALQGDIKEMALPGCRIEGCCRLVEVTKDVKLVVVDKVCLSLQARHGRRVLGVDRPGCVEIAVGFLGSPDLGGQPIDIYVEFGVGMPDERIGGGLNDLVDVGVIKGVFGAEFSLHRAADEGQGQDHGSRGKE